MTENTYKYLQERLSNKAENNPYKYTACFKYERGYKEGIAAAKSILSEFYHNANSRENYSVSGTETQNI